MASNRMNYFWSLLKKGFLKKYRVSPQEADGFGALKVGSIFNWMQDSMDEYSSVLGVGADYCQEHGINYALRSSEVDVLSLPVRGVSVPVHTSLRGLTPVGFVLQQNMYDPSFRNILLSATSQVVLLNATDGHWVRANRYLPAFITEAIESKPYSLPLIPPQGRVDSVYDEVVPWDYIDANQHVNNARYVEMATKGLSPIQLKQMYLRHIAANFKHAAKCGEHLQVQTQVNPGSSLHRIVSKDNNDQTCAKLYFEWAKRNMRYHEKVMSQEVPQAPEEPRVKVFAVDKTKKTSYTPAKRIRGANGYVY